MTRVAVVLSGCGHQDGAEVRESVLALLYLDQQDAEVTIFAPDIEQYHVVDHRTGEPTDEKRNVMTEAARIARGEIQPLSECDVGKFDALIIPGGFGMAKNLSDFAFKGEKTTVISEFRSIVNQFVVEKKPVGAICISPAIVAAALMGQASPTLTIGDDKQTAGRIEAFGAKHQNCATDGMVYDDTLKIASCSAYMRNDRLAKIAKGIEQVVAKVLQVARSKPSKQAA